MPIGTKSTVVATRAELRSLIHRSLAGEDGGAAGVLVLAPELWRAREAA